MKAAGPSQVSGAFLVEGDSRCVHLSHKAEERWGREPREFCEGL